MTDEFPDAAEVARRLADALEREGVPYAIGGAIAYGYFGAARGTKDVDVNLFVSPDDARPALAALIAAGVRLDTEKSVARGRERGDAVGYFGLMRVDLFFNSIELHDEAAKRTRTVSLLGRPIQILSAEDTVILKAFFNRGKDWVDIERLVARQGAALDRAEIRRWLVDGVGEDDPRVQRWDAVSEALPAT
jgi:hypothetical protein